MKLGEITEGHDTGVVIPLGEMYGDIKALRTDMTTLLTRFDETIKTIADHEARIRSLERRFWIATGFVTLLAVLSPYFQEFARMIGN